MTLRAFIAVDLAPLPALEGFIRSLAQTGGLKAVDSSSLHVTLKFLGDTEEALLPRIGEVMRAAVSGIPPFQVEVIGSGVFPPKGGARVVWAGLKGAEPMTVVASRLEKGLEPLGFEPEARQFKPHLTLARVKDPAAGEVARRVADSQAQGQFGSKLVSELYLKKSVLRPQGPEYSTLISVPFA
jgi:2'-5' RNA ligase